MLHEGENFCPAVASSSVPYQKQADNKQLNGYCYGIKIAILQATYHRRRAQMADLGSTKMIDEYRAAALLGLPLPDLRWFSRVLGLGHVEAIGNASQTVFTYDELRRLSSEAAASSK